MRKVSLCTPIFVGIAALSLAGASGVADNSGLKDLLVAKERQSWEAWKARDGKFFQEFLSDDHLEVGFNGRTNKASVVAGVASPVCVVKLCGRSFRPDRVFQYADRPSHALAEAARVAGPRGRVLAAIWGNPDDCEALACVGAVGSFLPRTADSEPGALSSSPVRSRSRRSPTAPA